MSAVPPPQAAPGVQQAPHQQGPQPPPPSVMMYQTAPGIQIQTIGPGQPVGASIVPGQVAQPLQGQQSTIVIGATQPPQIVCQSPGSYENYKHKMARTLGITQVVVGSLAFIFQISAIVVSAGGADGGTGVWSGILFVITGSIAIGSASSKQSCMIVSTMVMSIISAVVVWALFITAAVGLGIDNNCNHYLYGYSEKLDCKESEKIAMNVLLLMLALVEIVASIWQSAVCCAAVCCGRRTPIGGAVIQNYPNTNQMIITNNPTQGQTQTYPQQYTYTQGVNQVQGHTTQVVGPSVQTVGFMSSPQQNVAPYPQQDGVAGGVGGGVSGAPPAYMDVATAPPQYSGVSQQPLPQKN